MGLTRIAALPAALITAMLLAGGTAFAASSQALQPVDEAKIAEIIATAKPREQSLPKLPAATFESLEAMVEGEATPAVTVGAVGNGTAEPESFPTTKKSGKSADAAGEIDSMNAGKGNSSSVYQFTDSKVDAQITANYPYRTTGYFYFKGSDNTWYWCTAALISNSIMLTAGHCVHDGGNGSKGWIKEGIFYPARQKDTYPYGNASVVTLYTTDGWYSKGQLDKGYDIGLAVLTKRNNHSKEMGYYTGYLGFCYKNCLTKYWFTTQLGYPKNYYNGNQMSQSNHLAKSDDYDFEVGTGMQGGSSGGPHVANLGPLANSANYQGEYSKRNVVFAVTSWGYTDEKIMIQGASTTSGPNNKNDFVNLFNTACKKARSRYGNDSCDLL